MLNHCKGHLIPTSESTGIQGLAFISISILLPCETTISVVRFENVNITNCLKVGNAREDLETPPQDSQEHQSLVEFYRKT